jgi:hypothetical protein
MSNVLLYYQRVNPTTWAYLSSLLLIALFFKFSRVWSVRNLDLIGLILLAPGLLCVIYGQDKGQPDYQQAGYIWLFVVSGLFLVRMLLDPLMVRRPLLEPNLSVGGMTFLGLSLLLFLMANVATDRASSGAYSTPGAAASPPPSDTASQDRATAGAEEKPAADSSAQAPTQETALDIYGPGYPWVFDLFKLPTRFLFEGTTKTPSASDEQSYDAQRMLQQATARTVAVVSYLAIVFGLVFIGFRHFDNTKAGIAAAVLYLLLPYTAILTGRYLALGNAQDSPNVGQVYHVLLAALLVWSVAMYRRPLVSGILLGVAVGMFYYPIFLLPLWCSFYWQRGIIRFAGGVLAMLLVLVAILYFHPYSGSFGEDLRQMFGAIIPRMQQKNLQGFWGLQANDPVFRVPVMIAFGAMCITLAIWPAQKNLGTLLSGSAAVMVGVQFWHALGGGQLLGWYLPVLLLTVFRPNLEDRVALSVLGQWHFGRRKPRLAAVDRAA